MMTAPDPGSLKEVEMPHRRRGRARGRDRTGRRFVLYTPVLIAVVLYFAALIGTFVYFAIWRDRPEMLSRLPSIVVVHAIIIGLPTLIVWGLSRSRMVGNIVCVLVMSLMVFVFVGTIVKAIDSTTRATDARDQFRLDSDEWSHQFADLLARSAAGNDVSGEMMQLFRVRAKSIADAREESRGIRAAWLDSMAVSLRLTQFAWIQYSDALSAFARSGGLSVDGVLDSSDIAQRLERADELAAANDALREAYARLEGDLRSEFAQRRITPGDMETVIERWKQIEQPDVALRSRDLDQVIIARASDILRLLNDSMGSWWLEEDEVVFEDDAVALRLNLLYEELMEAAEQQAALQGEAAAVSAE